jgi:hypothetical protein
LAQKSGSSQSKGNPAHKRMSNEKLKVRRARSYTRTRARALMHAAAQRARETANKARRQNKEPTPWEVACAKRDEKRKPLQEAYSKRHTEDVLTAS